MGNLHIDVSAYNFCVRKRAVPKSNFSDPFGRGHRRGEWEPVIRAPMQRWVERVCVLIALFYGLRCLYSGKVADMRAVKEVLTAARRAASSVPQSI